uniref:Uncharacterized protein n=1 Tax=Trichobilharzia regenti TaxID=157069 RepID=A0AA85JQJ7_TRIRE|nr:unnamed protein product [Trichobilharzia regenti]
MVCGNTMIKKECLILKLCLLCITIRLTFSETLLSSDFLRIDETITCLSNSCEDIQIMEFGFCGAQASLTYEHLDQGTLTVKFERIYEVVEKLLNRRNKTEYFAFVSLLVTEENSIQWLTLFRDVEYLVEGRRMVGEHTVLALGHERLAKKATHKITQWNYYLLYVDDYTQLPLDCDDPPTKITIKSIKPPHWIILGRVYYTVTEPNWRQYESLHKN